ncbi:hypothetical protein ACLKA6_001978 [Drosophila palustris]
MPKEILRRTEHHRRASRTHYTLRDYGPPSVPHKTSGVTVDIRNFTTLQENSTAINKTNNKRIPVPDPGVPALPEMTTYSSSPSKEEHWIRIDDNFVSDQVLQDAPVAAGTPRESL